MRRVDRMRRKRARTLGAVAVVVLVVFVAIILGAVARSAAVARQRTLSENRLRPLRVQVAAAKAETASLERQRAVLLRSGSTSVSPALSTYDQRKMAPVPRKIRTVPVPMRAKPPGPHGYTSIGVFTATAYCLTGTTANGSKAGPGRIAVDPRVIPLGTRLYVEGYGECVAVDTGGAIKGRIIDVWFSDRAQCMRWGRRSVNVWRAN